MQKIEELRYNNCLIYKVYSYHVFLSYVSVLGTKQAILALGLKNHQSNLLCGVENL